MNVLEIKNNLLKIDYDVRENLILSGFVLVEDENAPYVGQIMSLGASADANYAMVKLLFTFSADGLLKDYDGSIPSSKSKITKLDAGELLDIIPVKTPVVVGRLAQQGTVLKIDKAAFEDNFVICSNKYEDTDFLLLNFVKQFEKMEQKTVVFDTNGDFAYPGVVAFGEDFKLPLDVGAMDFILDNDLTDVDAASKAVIQEIFIELQDYVKTTPEKFIPFDTFLQVIEQQHVQTGIPELLLLKNKLIKYKGVFAQNEDEVAGLSRALTESNTTIFDISKAESTVQREMIFHTYKIMDHLGGSFYSFVKINNENSTKKLLKRFVEKATIFTIPICTHEYKYLQELKQMAGNMVLFAPLSTGHDFANYNTFLHKLNIDEFIIFGTYTQNIPLIVQLEDIDEIPLEEQVELPSFEEITVEPAAASTVEPLPPIVEPVVETVVEIADAPIVQVAAPQAEPELVPSFTADELDMIEESLDVEPASIAEPETVQPLDAMTELPAAEAEIIDDEHIIIEDESLVEELDDIPIYPADDIDHRNVPHFEKGDSVSHPKYGQGVVEKMIKYGNKTLVSIDFQDVGRRLLDPAISEISKMI